MGAALAVAEGMPGWAVAGSGAEPGPVRVWQTFRDRRYAEAEPLRWKPATEFAADAIVLDPATAKQSILGFGGAMTDATCFVLSRMKAEARAALMHDLFAPGEMALSVCRTTIGASDYSVSLYGYDESDAPDPEMKRFSIEHDKAYILPLLREARKVNPEMFLFASPWSPPGWMKPNKSMLGGVMRESMFAPYAE